MRSLNRCAVLLLAVACAPNEAVIDDHDEPADVETTTGSQGLVSNQSYYHWANRKDAGKAPYRACAPNLRAILRYLTAHYGGTDLGCFGVRSVRGGTSPSSHSWGAAQDYQPPGGSAQALSTIAPFLIAHSAELGINTIHDYVNQKMWKPGQGWVSANIGTPGGQWLHIETTPGAYFDGRSVDERLVTDAPGPDGCTQLQRSNAAAYGCGCRDGVPFGGACAANDRFVFDPAFYLSLYGDLRAAFGSDLYAAAQHWNQHGLAEGRTGSPLFSAPLYLALNPDVAAAYGATNYAGAASHWVTFGLGEGRGGSYVYSSTEYLALNGDVAAAFGASNCPAAADHFLRFGIAEGRRGSNGFSARTYLERYSDLAAVFGPNGYAQALAHYLSFGIAEGRSGQ